MTPAPRDLPVLVVEMRPDHTYRVVLPGNIEVTRKSRSAIEEVCRREASGSALRFVQR